MEGRDGGARWRDVMEGRDWDDGNVMEGRDSGREIGRDRDVMGYFTLGVIGDVMGHVIGDVMGYVRGDVMGDVMGT
jgi:hypothetical protein